MKRTKLETYAWGKRCRLILPPSLEKLLLLNKHSTGSSLEFSNKHRRHAGRGRAVEGMVEGLRGLYAPSGLLRVTSACDSDSCERGGLRAAAAPLGHFSSRSKNSEV